MLNELFTQKSTPYLFNVAECDRVGRRYPNVPTRRLNEPSLGLAEGHVTGGYNHFEFLLH